MIKTTSAEATKDARETEDAPETTAAASDTLDPADDDIGAFDIEGEPEPRRKDTVIPGTPGGDP